ncbi:MAG: hypothetical protein C5S38_10025 [Candidatus Methanophagaceae archaeon]|nr:MAG: hypothetical protein C5S38_10025 [Methanophagales archaeon]
MVGCFRRRSSRRDGQYRIYQEVHRELLWQVSLFSWKQIDFKVSSHVTPFDSVGLGINLVKSAILVSRDDDFVKIANKLTTGASTFVP